MASILLSQTVRLCGEEWNSPVSTWCISRVTCHFVSPLCKKRCFVASVSEELHLVSVVLGNAPGLIFLFSFFFLIFLFYFFILSTEWGIWTLTPNCERPGNWWAKIHNRLILYIYMYKSPWTQWRISKTVYKGILIMRVNKHDLKIKLIWSLIFWSLSSQRGLRPSDKIWGA